MTIRKPCRRCGGDKGPQKHKHDKQWYCDPCQSQVRKLRNAKRLVRTASRSSESTQPRTLRNCLTQTRPPTRRAGDQLFPWRQETAEQRIARLESGNAALKLRVA